MSALTDARRIADRLSGRSAGPRDRARLMDALLAPLIALTDLPGLSECEIARDDASEADEWRWAETEALTDGPPVMLGVPAPLAAHLGTVLMGGSPGEATDDATPIDWSLAEATLDALAGSLVPPRRFARWSKAGPGDGERAALALTIDGSTHRIGLHAALAAQAPTRAEPMQVATRPTPPRPRVDLPIAATLDLAPRTLREAVGLTVGEIVPLADGLDAVAVRHDGRALLNGALGHAGGWLCVRVTDRAAASDAFEALRPPPVSAREGPAQAASPTTTAHDAPTEPAARRRAP